MQFSNKIVPCLWFDGQAEEAAKFYASLFPDSRIVQVMRTPDAGQEEHGQAPGSVLVVSFELAGQSFTGLNGGPMFKFTEAVSLQVICKDQAELDHYWDGLLQGGEMSQCGWLKDKFGLSWQVTPKRLLDMYEDKDPQRIKRVFSQMMTMRKLDIAPLEKAFNGN
jgi:predicted 3-demethylubiquinone-9 3-methyltransferase (glyoxalase superfamily)